MTPSDLIMSAMGQADWRTEYEMFLARKENRAASVGFDPCVDWARGEYALHDWQQRITEWSCRKGRSAIFAGTGLGKTAMQLEWARQVAAKTDQRCLVFAPLAVGKQTEREGGRFGINCRYVRMANEIQASDSIVVTNYERLKHFTGSDFGGIVLDESSILKALDGKTRLALTEFARDVPFRLCCTATPAPNDHVELGQHAEFLGVCTAQEMLSTYFVHDGGDTSKWRLKRHARADFWRWVCSWAVAVQKPSDIGGDDTGYDLPPLRIHEIVVESESDGTHLFAMEAQTLNERRAARRASLERRVEETANIINGKDGPALVWCDLNSESEALTGAIVDAIEVRGSDKAEAKESNLIGFAEGEVRVIVTKPSIAGWGMNWQHCNRMAFVGLSDSFEQLYQAIRRCWRFGQTQPVDVYVVTSEAEGAVVRNIKRKEREASEMMTAMVNEMKDEHELSGKTAKRSQYAEDEAAGDGWTLRRGDSVKGLDAVDSDSIDYSVFSPPFSSLYTYTDLTQDMGNCSGDDQFFEHMRFLIKQIYRVTKPGRLCSFHCMDLPSTKSRDGVIGLRDFRGELIRAFSAEGWIYHSLATIWKDPVTAMQRTKALGLLWKQIQKDSSMSRMGIPDYVVTMRKPGENLEPIAHSKAEFPVDQWQKWASPVWSDINPSDTLQYRSARADEDERHICPLQLEVIRRCLRLWSNPGDLVLSPFAGIGSEGVEAVKNERRFIGFEIKESYYEQARLNLAAAVNEKSQERLF